MLAFCYEYLGGNVNILLCGDVVGRSGRDAIAKYIPMLKSKLSLDFILVNVDNAAHGFGVTKEMAINFFDLGIDVLTGGNHIFDQKEAIALLAKEKRLLRPANLSDKINGSGICETVTKRGKKIITIHLIGQKSMPLIGENPFEYAEKILKKYKLKENADAIIIDFHADVTSEKNALGQFLDGKVSAIVGTHTHIPTSDGRILTNGTAYQTDIGMCGDYNSVIGMIKGALIDKFIKGYVNAKFSPASGEATLSGLFVQTDDTTGLAISAKAIKIGGELLPTLSL